MRKNTAAGLRATYAASTVEEAELQLDIFEEKWDEAYLPILVHKLKSDYLILLISHQIFVRSCLL